MLFAILGLLLIGTLPTLVIVVAILSVVLKTGEQRADGIRVPGLLGRILDSVLDAVHRRAHREANREHDVDADSGGTVYEQHRTDRRQTTS